MPPLFPVTKKPSERDEARAEFLDPVWDLISVAEFKNTKEFEIWFHEVLLPGIVSDFGGKNIGDLMIAGAFPSDDLHFMRWVLMKFTTMKKHSADDLRF